MSSCAPWIGRLFTTIDAKDTAGFVDFLTEDAKFRFGNAEPTIGRTAINAAVDAFFSSIRSSHHNIEYVWSTPKASACHGTVTYSRQDGKTVTLPFANVMYHDADNKIHDYLIHIDIAPLYAT